MPKPLTRHRGHSEHRLNPPPQRNPPPSSPQSPTTSPLTCSSPECQGASVWANPAKVLLFFTFFRPQFQHPHSDTLKGDCNSLYRILTKHLLHSKERFAALLHQEPLKLPRVPVSSIWQSAWHRGGDQIRQAQQQLHKWQLLNWFRIQHTWYLLLLFMALSFYFN